MTSPAAYAPFFQIHQLLGGAAVDGFTPEAWSTRPHPACTHPTWILTHVVGVRRALARNLGTDVPREDWEDQVEFGGECLPASEYPAPAALADEYVRLGETIAGRLAELDETSWQRRYEPDFPDGNTRTLAEAVPFLISHEALHIGQLSLVRRMHELPGVASVALARMNAAGA